MRRPAGIVLLLLVIGMPATLGIAAWRWRAETARVVATLDRAPATAAASRYRHAMTDGLPAPVVRYFEAVLREGQPVVTRWRVEQSGSFRTGAGAGSWRPFEAVQHFRALPPGMVWDARIRMGPGLEVVVRDAWSGGHGAMRGRLLALLPLVDAPPGPALDSATLQRYLAEAVWCPTALLPVNGVRWSALDDSTARATITDAGVSATLDFRFGADSLIVSSRTDARPRAVGRGYEPTPWGGVYADVQLTLGMRAPRTSEVAWTIAGRREPYWIGRLTRFEDLSPGR